MAKGFKDEKGKFRPTEKKKIRDVSDDDIEITNNVNVDEDALEEFARGKAKMEFEHGNYLTQQIFKFDNAPEDLKEKILEKNRYINLDSDYWADYDGIIYDKKTNIADYDVFKNYSKKYYDIERGQYIQFPDLEIKDDKKLLKMLGLPESILKKVTDIGFNSERENNTKIIFRDLLSNEIDADGTYDDYTKYIDDDYKSEMLTKKQFEELQRATEKWDDLMHDAWVNLRDNYEYQYTDEAVKETIEANDYDFDEDGNLV